ALAAHDDLVRPIHAAVAGIRRIPLARRHLLWGREGVAGRFRSPSRTTGSPSAAPAVPSPPAKPTGGDALSRKGSLTGRRIGSLSVTVSTRLRSGPGGSTPP